MALLTRLLVVALVLLYLARQLVRYSALSHFGGHWSAGWSRLWLLRTQSSGHMHKTFTDINRKYGNSSTYPILS
jgi:hypothetical protein